MKQSFIDELWNLYDDDQSGFFEKAEVFLVIHALIVRIPETQDIWGEILKEDTEKYCRKMWNKCKEFNVGKRKKISKEEFTNFMYYVNEMEDMNELVDLKELKDKAERREHDKMFAEFASKNRMNSEGIRRVIIHLENEEVSLDPEEEKLSPEEINEMALQCVDELGGGKPFLNKKKFYRFKSWYDRQDGIQLLSTCARCARCERQRVCGPRKSCLALWARHGPTENASKRKLWRRVRLSQIS